MSGLSDEIQQAIDEGRAIICYSKCWPCQFGEHLDPAEEHTWMDQEDAEHAGHPWPLPPEVAAKNVCGCGCAKPAGDGR